MAVPLEAGDLLALMAGAEGTAAGEYLTSYAGLGQLIRTGSAEGMSGRSILAAYRDAGGVVTDANYWRLRGAVLSADTPPFGRDLATGIQGGNVREVPGGKEGLYQINFRVFVQHDPETGLPEHSVTNFSMTQRDLDIPDAANAMSNLMETLDNPADSYGRWIGFEITGVTRYTG